MIYVIATLRIEPGSLASIMELVKPLLEATRLEDGCISYDLHCSISDAETLVFVERWDSRAALDAHFTTFHVGEWRKCREPYVVSAKLEIIHPERVEAQ